MADYNILALGPPGRERRSISPALYSWIISGQLAEGVKIDLNYSAGQYLAETYGQVADPISDWPPGTAAPPLARIPDALLRTTNASDRGFSGNLNT